MGDESSASGASSLFEAAAQETATADDRDNDEEDNQTNDGSNFFHNTKYII